MKTTVVPAQITTVEDRIAGSLTLVQILLLIIPMVIGVLIYSSFGPKMHASTLKIVLIVMQALFFGILAIRYQGKILGDWLIVILRFRARPRQYIYTKKDLSHRQIVIEKPENDSKTEQAKETMQIAEIEELSLLEQLKVKKIMESENLSVSFKVSKKGGFDVSLKEIKG